MEYDIQVNHGLEGHIEIEDVSVNYLEYVAEDDSYMEDTECVENNLLYKYSQSVTINIVAKVNTDAVTLLDAYVTEHDELYDAIAFDVTQDGYYQVTHLVLPTLDWYNEIGSDSEIFKVEGFTYYIYDKKTKQLVKLVNGQLLQATVAEIAYNSNPVVNNLEKTVIDIFYLGFLKACFMDWCKKLFDKLMANCRSNCKPTDASEESYARDFLWMTLNIIKYLVHFNLHMEAQRILEQINYCGGFCQNANQNSNNSCGCGCSCSSSAHSMGCGCH